mmetsp:Transcript_52963/g.121612  ORF Transcript_52963/g.121612 Transcript_52963/m.121612 type:complete len:231 (+) Transcript_52963:962-1654(+)
MSPLMHAPESIMDKMSVSGCERHASASSLSTSSCSDGCDEGGCGSVAEQCGIATSALAFASLVSISTRMSRMCLSASLTSLFPTSQPRSCRRCSTSCLLPTPGRSTCTAEMATIRSCRSGIRAALGVALRNRAARWRCPCFSASSAGRCPATVRRVVSAPASSNAWILSSRPINAAKCSAVAPVALVVFTCAPRRSSSRTRSLCSVQQAFLSNVSWWSACNAFTSPPASR